MRVKVFILFLLVSLTIAFNAGDILAQNNTAAQDSAISETAQENTQTVIPDGSEMQWLWGEVSSVDPQKNEVAIKYLDYETDTEKEIIIAADENTTYDNVKSINDIKTDDIISVDYVFKPDGRYIAKNISIEKSEDKPELQKKITGEVENLTNATAPVTQ